MSSDCHSNGKKTGGGCYEDGTSSKSRAFPRHLRSDSNRQIYEDYGEGTLQDDPETRKKGDSSGGKTWSKWGGGSERPAYAETNELPRSDCSLFVSYHTKISAQTARSTSEEPMQPMSSTKRKRPHEMIADSPASDTVKRVSALEPAVDWHTTMSVWLCHSSKRGLLEPMFIRMKSLLL